MISSRGILWLLRIAWMVLPLVAGPNFADALNERSTALRTTASLELWAAWALVVVALMIPSILSLVVIRVIAIGAPIACAGALINVEHIDAKGGPLGLGVSLAIAIVALSPQLGEISINAGAYGDERRFMLRAPGALFLGPIQIAWLFLVLGITTGPLVLSDGQWVLGGIAVVVGLAISVLLTRSFYLLCQRWIVFVPAGVVLKDHHAVLDPVLFRRSEIELLHPAPGDSDALDLTSHSPGLALELRLNDKIPMMRVMPGRQPAQPGKTARLLFTPTRPGAVLSTAKERRIKVD